MTTARTEHKEAIDADIGKYGKGDEKKKTKNLKLGIQEDFNSTAVKMKRIAKGGSRNGIRG